jgi:hypothetical protein
MITDCFSGLFFQTHIVSTKKITAGTLGVPLNYPARLRLLKIQGRDSFAIVKNYAKLLMTL